MAIFQVPSGGHYEELLLHNKNHTFKEITSLYQNAEVSVNPMNTVYLFLCGKSIVCVGVASLIMHFKPVGEESESRAPLTKLL